MGLLLNAVANLFVFLRNAYVRALRRPPDLIWIGISDSQRGDNRFGPNPKGE